MLSKAIYMTPLTIPLYTSRAVVQGAVDEKIAFDARASQRVYIMSEKRRGVTHLWMKKSHSMQ